MIKILNICLHQNSIVIKFLKILKIHEIFCENPRNIFVLFYDVHKENMFTINLEDGCEAPSKASTDKCVNVDTEICGKVSKCIKKCVSATKKKFVNIYELNYATIIHKTKCSPLYIRRNMRQLYTK